MSKKDLRYAALLLARGDARNAVELQHLYFPHVTAQTIRNGLKTLGLQAYVMRKRPLLNRKAKRRRWAWARAHILWTPQKWRHVIFSDEARVDIFGSDGIQWCWRMKGDAYQGRYIKKTVKHGGGSIMMWGCITKFGLGRLQRIDGTMDRFKYVSILEEGLLGTLHDKGIKKRGLFFQQDNDPKHASKFATTWFKKKKIKLLPWPSWSPDMNITEHVWGELKRRVARRSPRPSNKKELWKVIQEEWRKIGLEFVNKLYDSMPSRVLSLKRARGSYTKY